MNLQIDGFSANRNLLGKENGGLSFFCKNRRGKRAVFKFFFFVFFALFSSLSFGNDYTISTWSSFVSVYNNADSEDALSLNADITAAADISAGSPASPITIKSYRLNPVTLSGGNRYRGFVLGDKEINFADIRFNDFKLIGNGAAIYLQNQSTATFSGRHISFANNISTSGAGLTASSSTIEFFRSGNVRNTLEVYFLSNSAAGNNSSVGGAVALFAASQMSFSNASTVNFSSNSAIGNGGALYIGGASQLNVSDSRVVFYGNVSTGNYGGAIYSNASQLSFNNSNISFISNTAFYNGGAITSSGSRITFINSTASFIGNTIVRGYGTGQGGGAIEIDFSSMIFSHSAVIFNSNSAAANGGAISMLKGTLIFDYSVVSFIDNWKEPNEGGYGGAIDLRPGNNTLIFNNSNVSFIRNTGRNGGAISGAGGGNTIEFVNSTISFINNYATGNGSAIGQGDASFINSSVSFIGNINPALVSGGLYSFSNSRVFFINTEGSAVSASGRSTVSFTSSSLIFDGNNGGAVIANEGFVRFAASTVSFTSNSSAGNGGAIYANTDFSLVSFTTSEVKFTSNVSALAGGALNLDLARSEYINSNIIFEGNTAQGPGGAVYVYTGMTFFEKTALSFKNNLSLSSGGALYAEQEMRRNGNNIFFEFVGNQAFAGGAVFYRGFNMELSNALFENNTALSSGGAVYIRGMNASKETEFAVSAVERDSIFTGNKMAGGAIDNDIFIEDGAGSVKLILNAAKGRKIELNGGIIGYGTAGAIVKEGAGDLFLAPTFYNGAFTVNEGSVFTTSNAYSGISSFSFRTFRIENGGKFSTADGIEDNISVVDSFSLNGLWEAEIDFEKQFADKIIVSPVIGSYASFDALSKLQIKVASSDGKYAAIGSSAAIMISPLILSAHSGKIFSNKNAFDRRALYDIFMTTAAGDYQLWVRVSDIVDFESIAKNGNEGKVGGRVNSILDNGISNKITDALMFLASEKNNALVRDAIDQIDGHFYPNLLKSSLINTDADVLYERIMPGSGEHTNAWLEFFGGANLLTSKDYPEQNFKKE
ncbi:MAG: hypothetical protein LBH29_06400, partial [Elusimicrobiota bacterium]|nr:hypothetical protein [Elusimicrobiota bacterium]